MAEQTEVKPHTFMAGVVRTPTRLTAILRLFVATMREGKLRIEDKYGLTMLAISALLLWKFPERATTMYSDGKPLNLYLNIIFILLMGICGFELISKKVSDLWMQMMLLPLVLLSGILCLVVILLATDGRDFLLMGIMAIISSAFTWVGYGYVSSVERERP